MKKLMIMGLLTLMTAEAYAAVWCRSYKDYDYVALFEGYSCPSGYYFVKYHR